MLNLSFSVNLMQTPDFTGIPNLLELDVSCCSQLESMPEDVGVLENLVKLNARCTLISQPPASIFRLNMLKFLSFAKYKSEYGACFAFPQVNEGLRSLEHLNLSYCNIIDGGLPEDIGCLSSLKVLNLRGNNFEHLPRSISQLGDLRSLNLSDCRKLKELPGFMGMQNLEIVNLSYCNLIDGVLPEDIGCLFSLKELDLRENKFEHLPGSIAQLRALRSLDLSDCRRLKELPGFMGMPNLGFHVLKVESLESLNLEGCRSLEKFPEILGRMKPELEIKVEPSGIMALSPSIIHLQDSLTELKFNFMSNLVALPSSISKLKGLVKLYARFCSKLEILPEEIGDLENLEELDALWTLISRPPSSIFLLNKLKYLSFAKGNLEDGVSFVFPEVNKGLHSLEYLNLNYCNIIDGGLPEDIGCLSSLKVWNLRGNNFVHLPRSMAQLVALQFLNLSDCRRLKDLPDFMGTPNLDTLDLSNCMNLEEIHHSLGFLIKLCTLKLTNCRRLKSFSTLCIDSLEYMDLEGCPNLKKFPEILGSMKVESEIHMLDSVMRDLNSFPHSLSQNIISLRHDISASDSFSLRVFSVKLGGNKIPSWFHHQGTDKKVSVNLPENWYIPDNLLGFVVCYTGKLSYTTIDLIPLCDDGLSWMTLKTKSYCRSKWDTESSIQLFFVPFVNIWNTSIANGKAPHDYGRIRLSFSGKLKQFGFRLLYKDEPKPEALLRMRENNYDDSEHQADVSCSFSKKQRLHF
ncbi:TMV resistance protein N-like [Capsicum galapagoense]